MTPLLRHLADATLMGGALVVAVLILQAILRQKIAPRWWVGLWMLVALRFLIPLPISASAPIPMLPAAITATAEPLPPTASTPHSNPAPVAAPQTPSVREASTDLPAKPWPVVQILVALWAAGALVSAAAVARQVLRLRRLVNRPHSTDPRLLTLLESAKARLNIRTPIGLVVTADIGTPAIIGWLHPCIALPSAFAGSLDDAALERILVHELCHFKRADIPALWLGCLVQIVHWFNPLAYILARQLRDRIEEACDVLAIRTLQGPAEAYGETLLAAVRVCSQETPLTHSPLVATSFSNLKHRMKLITSPAKSSPVLTILALAAALLAAFVTLVPAEEKTAASEKSALSDPLSLLEGYDGIPWGSSVEEVEKLVPGMEKSLDDGFVAIYKIPSSGAFLEKQYAFHADQLVQVNAVLAPNLGLSESAILEQLNHKYSDDPKIKSALDKARISISPGWVRKDGSAFRRDSPRAIRGMAGKEYLLMITYTNGKLATQTQEKRQKSFQEQQAENAKALNLSDQL